MQLLKGELYCLQNNEWEHLFCKLLKIDNTCLSLVHYKNRKEKKVKRVTLLDNWSVRKDEIIRIPNGNIIYPFTIVRPQHNLVFATHNRDERRRWLYGLIRCGTQVLQCPLDTELFSEPAMVCNSAWDIVSANFNFMNFLGKEDIYGKKVSTILPDGTFEAFCTQCQSINSNEGLLNRHAIFYYIVKKPDTTQAPFAFQISLLKQGNKNFYLCLVVAPSREEVMFQLMDNACRDSFVRMIQSVIDLTKECQNLRQKIGPDKPSAPGRALAASDPVLRFPKHVIAPASALLTNAKKTQSPVPKLSGIRGKSLSMLGFVNSSKDDTDIRSQSPLSSRRILCPEFDKVVKPIVRTDGFTPRISARGLLTSRKISSPLTSVHRAMEVWSKMPLRVTILGGGNTMLLAFQLAMSGALVTIAEYQQERAKYINDQQWYKLDEIAASVPLATCASVMMDIMESSRNVTRICATTYLSAAVKFSDVVIMETPNPFDALFKKQLDDISEELEPGQLLVLDCDVSDPVDTIRLLVEASPQCSSVSFLGGMSCTKYLEYSAEFENIISPLLSANWNQENRPEEDIPFMAKQFMRKCCALRLKELVIDKRNSNLCSEIAVWFLQSAQKFGVSEE